LRMSPPDAFPTHPAVARRPVCPFFSCLPAIHIVITTTGNLVPPPAGHPWSAGSPRTLHVLLNASSTPCPLRFNPQLPQCSFVAPLTPPRRLPHAGVSARSPPFYRLSSCHAPHPPFISGSVGWRSLSPGKKPSRKPTVNFSPVLPISFLAPFRPLGSCVLETARATPSIPLHGLVLPPGPRLPVPL